MDPDATYYLLIHHAGQADNASDDERAALAQIALDLRNWLNRGGFYPQYYTPVTVRANINNALRKAGHETGYILPCISDTPARTLT